MTPPTVTLVLTCSNGLRVGADVPPGVISRLTEDPQGWLELTDVVCHRPGTAGEQAQTYPLLRVAIAHVVSWRLENG